MSKTFPSGSDRRKREKILYIRVNADEAALIAGYAATAGVTVAEYLRRRAMGHPVVSRESAKSVADLSKIAGLVKHLFNEGQLDSEQGRQLLKSLGAAANRIRRDDDSDGVASDDD